MNNNKIENIKKSAKTASQVTNVFSKICLAGAIIALVSAIIVVCFAKQINEVITYSNGHWVAAQAGYEQLVSMHGFAFVDAFDFKNFAANVGLNCLCGAVIAAVAFIALGLISKAFTAIKESDTPFTEEILNKVRIAAILTTIIVALSSVGMALVVGVSFWCLCSIFNYGIELQKNEDETL